MKRKGFTLVELLAVIVILAVIAIITIPLIGNIIDTVKKGALGASANGIIESAELYYSTKMLENPETKTFICSKEGCVSGEERLDYKGEITEGRVILYADGKVSICIEDGKNAALKLTTQTEVTTEEGSCNYENEEYSIDATVSKTKYNELVEELTNGKKVISEAITNKGVETEELATFEEMASNIDKISTGIEEEKVKNDLYNSLQYSGLVTEDMTLDEMYEILSLTYPNYINLIGKEWTNSTTSATVETTDTSIRYSLPSTTLAVSYLSTDYFDITSFNKLIATGNSYGAGMGEYYQSKIYLEDKSGNKTLVFSGAENITHNIDVEFDLSELTGEYRVLLNVSGHNHNGIYGTCYIYLNELKVSV